MDMAVRVKRAYSEPANSDGFRILVDRFWPRGLSKERARVDLWPKEIAPSEGLRKWFAHDREKWAEFKRRYFEELATQRELTEWIRGKARGETVTLVYGAREEGFNNAVALKEYLEEQERRR